MANSLAANTKNVILKRKIGNDIYELLPKTQASQIVVSYGSGQNVCTDLADALSSIFTDITAWRNFIADVDFAGSDSALDTLRELIDTIADSSDVTSIFSRLGAIDKSITALETAVGSSGTLQSQIDALDTRLDALDETNGRMDAVEARVTALENAASYIYCGASLPSGVTLTERDLWIEVIEPAAGGGGE